MEVLSTFQLSNSENVSDNVLTLGQFSGKAVVPVKQPVLVAEEEVDEDSEEEQEEEEEEEEEEDENADSLPEGCLAPEHEALEASLYAAQLGISEGREVLEYVGQASWDRYDKVVDSYWKIVESEVRDTEYDQCAQEALQMNKRVDEVILKLAKDILPVTPASSAINALRDVFYSFVEKAIHKAYLFTENRGDFTIAVDDLREAFRLMNQKLPQETTQNLFSEMHEYDSADDSDYVEEDEEMVDQDEPLEWASDSDAELDEVQEDEQDEEEPETDWEFDHELLNDVVNHYIDLITPSDDPEDAEEQEVQEQEVQEKDVKEPEIQEVDVQPAGIELIQQMVQEFVQRILVSANKSAQYEANPSEKTLKRPLTNKEIKFVLDVLPELHF